MKVNGKYLVAVALLAILAVVFGLAGAVAPSPESATPQQTPCARAAFDGTTDELASTFIKVQDGQFVFDGRFRFMGANNPYLHYEPELMADDVMEGAARMGLTVIRCFGFLDGEPRPDGTVMQPNPGVYNENGFTKLDYVIKKAQEVKIRLVIVLTNNWDHLGGMDQYVAWVENETGRGLSHDDFYTDERCRQIYRDYVSYVLNRNNTYTGLQYRDDPTIMAWELANEPRCDSDKTGDTLIQWVAEMSAYIKSIDPNHLVAVGDGGFLNRPNATIYGYNGYTGVDWERIIELPNIDYGTFHLYPESWGRDWSETLQAGLNWIQIHCDLARASNIPVVLEEYGVKARNGENRNMIYEAWNDALYENDADGSMFWLLTGIDVIEERADDMGLYPDTSGFRIVEGTDTAQLLSEYAQLMSGELDKVDLPPRIYFIEPHEEEEISGNLLVTVIVFPHGKEVVQVTFALNSSDQILVLETIMIDALLEHTYAATWNTREELDHQIVEGTAWVAFADGSSASTSVPVMIANTLAQYVYRKQFTFDSDLEGFWNASVYQAEYGSPPIQHSDFNGGSLQANVRWFGESSWSEIVLAKHISDLSDYLTVLYEMYVPRSQLSDTDGRFRPFFALNHEKINLGSSDVFVSNAQVVTISGDEYYKVVVGSEYDTRQGKDELELGLVGTHLDYEGPIYVDNVVLIKRVATSSSCVIVNDHSGYLAFDGTYHLAGEVQNQGTTVAGQLWISVGFLDGNGLLIVSQTVPTLLPLLLPGETAPFIASVNSTQIGSYEFYNVTFFEVATDPLSLEIPSQSWTKTEGSIIVTGTVNNSGSYIIHAFHVVCTFYDSDGRVIGADNVTITDISLSPQEQKSFTITEICEPGRETAYATYQLTAMSNEYVVEPIKQYDLLVQVYDEGTNTPLSGATVSIYIYENGTLVKETITSATGYAAFTLPEADYYMTVQLEDYEDYDKILLFNQNMEFQVPMTQSRQVGTGIDPLVIAVIGLVIIAIVVIVYIRQRKCTS